MATSTRKQTKRTTPDQPPWVAELAAQYPLDVPSGADWNQLTAVYARLSDDPNGTREATKRQVADGLAYAAKRRWPTLTVVDDGISASRYNRTKPRTGYQAVLKAMQAGQVRRVVAWSMDRLYRQPVELEALINLADPAINGVTVDLKLLSGDIDLGTGQGRWFARSLVNQAAMESDQISRRVSRAAQALRAKGLTTSGTVPFGWRTTTKPEPKEAKLIREAVDRVLAGDSMAAVARDWNERRVPTKTGARWYNSTLRAILTNPRHAGLVPYTDPATGKRAGVSEAQWPAIVPRERWEQLQATLEANGNRHAQPRRSSLLTGLVVCHCGGTMIRDSHRGKPVWVCQNPPGYEGNCARNRLPALELEQTITEAAFALVDGADLARQAKTARPDPTASLAAELASLEQRESAAAASFAAGKLTPRLFEKASAELAAKQQQLRAQLARAADAKPLAAYAGRTGALRAAWEALSVERRRAVIAAALDLESRRIVVRAGKGWDVDRVDLASRRRATTVS
jgi:DNA invertase Pin-like site-specific DNA recombinase